MSDETESRGAFFAFLNATDEVVSAGLQFFDNIETGLKVLNLVLHAGVRTDSPGNGTLVEGSASATGNPTNHHRARSSGSHAVTNNCGVASCASGDVVTGTNGNVATAGCQCGVTTATDDDVSSTGSNGVCTTRTDGNVAATGNSGTGKAQRGDTNGNVSITSGDIATSGFTNCYVASTASQVIQGVVTNTNV